MKTIFFLAAVILCAQAFSDEELHQQWINFKVTHNKLYRSALEERRRFNIFKNNLKEIEEHNALYEAGVVTYHMGITLFADMTSEEFMDYVNQSSKYAQHKPNATEVYNVEAPAPASIDWRTKGAVTGVKNQGNCGSCWAFSTTGAIEGRYQIKTGKLISLSEQNLVDCSLDYGNHACDGGLTDSAFDYVKDHGITTEQEYPYKANLGYCQDKKTVLKISGYTDIKSSSEASLTSAVAEGPVAVAIVANNKLQHYTGGVFYDPLCGNFLLNHAVLVVGYGRESGKNFWIVKNSWGTNWGENGYVKIIRGLNQCGIATMASFPKV